MRTLIRIIACLLAMYLAASAFGELQLLRLVQEPKEGITDPRTYRGIQFPNAQEMSIFVGDLRRANFYPWLEPVPEWLTFIILAAAASFLGGATRDLRNRYRSSSETGAHYAETGLAIGPALLALSVAYPAFMTEGDLRLRPESLAAVCFLGGIFSDEAWEFLKRTVQERVFGGG